MFEISFEVIITCKRNTFGFGLAKKKSKFGLAHGGNII
jgi:hypothetical protein